MNSDEQLGQRLASLEGRLRLLLVHLTGKAIRSRVQVEDLVQEVYLRALSGKERLPGVSEGEVELFRYLRAVARHTVIDVARAARAGKRDGKVVRLERSDWSCAGMGGGESRVVMKGAGPFTQVAAREESEGLARAFEALSPEHRRVLGLRMLEGLTAAEAGKRMGRSEKAVHSLYRRALEAWGLAGR